ncbi:hypothetical protein GLOTRDRAFT_68450 [Gloeophyllum trabeum ATCC 11539]|uniref:cDENN domain-containing protein n=1 Tax=Gloeophyllum trabeum (strain ATCC 11539 / FP-39264 / Madison 617) TaxID=670483 RepID=S7QMK6_GLOTA|nr:uncharacterized protein GLOTRDRAFT_68450 [Gloeophyllum trabeum ATCC 11539]EPQ60637.1 hypothetical protein GLOTRDRAFT_68450 [Gloeophyllum trabeum ATCC 11539]
MASRVPSLQAPAVAASPQPSEKFLRQRQSDQSLREQDGKKASLSHKPTNVSARSTATARSLTKAAAAAGAADPKKAPSASPSANAPPVLNVVSSNGNTLFNSSRLVENIKSDTEHEEALVADELRDYINISAPSNFTRPSPDKASRILGIQHRRSMEPIPASTRTSIVSTRSARDPPPTPTHVPTLPLTSLYVVSGLPKSPHTWTLSDPDSVLGLHHSEGAVNRWWRPEVLGSTVTPGAGGSAPVPGSRKKRKGKDADGVKGAGALGKQEVGKMLSKALKLSFTREVEIIASTLQPASTIHTFTFTLPAPSTPLAPTPSGGLLRSSVFSSMTDPRASNTALSSLYPYHADDPFANARPSSAFLGPPSIIPPPHHGGAAASAADDATGTGATVTYHGVCLTVWSHADAERTAAIRRTLESGNANSSRSRKESAQSLVAARLKSLRADLGADPTMQARRRAKRSARSPWAGANTDGETDIDGDMTEGEGAMSESDFEVASTVNGHAGHGPGESTLFLPGDTVFWLPYALTLVSRHPIYDLMRDYLTLSWARFSKDVQSHTLQIHKILSHPAPRPGDLVRLDASANSKNDGGEANLEVIARFPGGLDFGKGLVDINFTMWPLFKALNVDNILTICEIALAPTGRVLFVSRHPAMLGIAVSTIKYLVELRGWNGIALPAVHSRDAKIYIDDPGPWIIGLSTEARYSVRPAPDVCICDIDINYLSCASPPPGVVSMKQQRDKYRQKLLAAFEPHYIPDHCVPSEFKEAFPAGRFRPVCKIQAKRGAASTAVADTIKPPEWWHSTRIIQAFDSVLQDKFKKPSLLKRISSFGSVKRPPRLSTAELHIQLSIRKRAMAFVDARDDLETKIGRLSRRLNFLMTESDLWRDKFVTFEQYAEKLSVEANDLRGKINKEQKETKRLSGIIHMTAAEKAKLQNQLKETEAAHQEAVSELQKMKEAMEKMEQERAAMVAEVEAQIEKALASMAAGMYDDDSDYDGSRPGSRMSSTSASGRRSRQAGDGSRTRHIRSFGTESTLADLSDGDDTFVKSDRKTGTIQEDEEEAPLSPTKKKRFSATLTDLPQDGMTAVDEGISERSDKIAQKVLQIQQKLETALAAESRTRRRKERSASQDSASDSSHSTEAVPARPHRSARATPKPARNNRMRSGTTSSTQTDRGTTAPDDKVSTATLQPPAKGSDPVAAVKSMEEQSAPIAAPSKPSELPKLRKISSGVSLSAMRPASPSALTPSTPALTPGVGTTDDSDTDFQSAYSASPRGSYAGPNGEQVSEEEESEPTENDHADDFGVGPLSDLPKAKGKFRSRRRVSSSATARIPADQPSPTLTEDTIVSPRRISAVAVEVGGHR